MIFSGVSGICSGISLLSPCLRSSIFNLLPIIDIILIGHHITLVAIKSRVPDVGSPAEYSNSQKGWASFSRDAGPEGREVQLLLPQIGHPKARQPNVKEKASMPGNGHR